MKITKSKILVLLLILVMTLMTACGGNSQPSGDEGSSGDAAQVNMKDMLTSLFTNQGDLGLAGKYTSTSWPVQHWQPCLEMWSLPFSTFHISAQMEPCFLSG